MKRAAVSVMLVIALTGAVWAQFAVFDPANYANACTPSSNGSTPSSSRRISKSAPSTCCCDSRRRPCPWT